MIAQSPDPSLRSLGLQSGEYVTACRSKKQVEVYDFFARVNNLVSMASEPAGHMLELFSDTLLKEKRGNG